jgi:hypothetical protein
MLAYTESYFFVGKQSDATNDEEWDLPLELHIGNRTGTVCTDPEFNRGAFKYLTIYIDVIPVLDRREVEATSGLEDLVPVVQRGQKVLAPLSDTRQTASGEKTPYSKPSVGIRQIWVNCTAFPSQKNGRAYSGYFYSSNPLLNRIWYAGAYTLQLSTIDPREGSALIPVNRFLDHNRSPPGSWYSNFTVAPGAAVTTDGAKRDRLVWPGDMYIAIPGIALSTYDMTAVKNALDVLYSRQYLDGRLPYAGPPLSYHDEFSDTYHLHTLLGTYEYVLYSGDIEWLRRKWPVYLRALRVSTAKIDSKNLMHVTSSFDWNRHGMEGHNVEANAILYTVLRHSIELASWLEDTLPDLAEAFERPDIQNWEMLARRLELGVQSLYCPLTGLYSDNLGTRHCSGTEHIDPQDGNSWILLSKMLNHSPDFALPINMSRTLRSRWNRFGAPAPEFPNVMSPFSSSFELQAHCAAGHHDAAVELALLMWGYLLDGPGFTNSTLAEGFRTDGYMHYPAYHIASRNSHAHGWAAGPTSTFLNDILGIRLLSPGGKSWSVRPVITGWLGWVRGGFATIRGKFEVSLRRVVLVNKRNYRVVVRKGVLAAIRGPPNTEGWFGWGDEEGIGPGVKITGNKVRAWVRWEDADGQAKLHTEEVTVCCGTDFSRSDEKWYEAEMPFGDSHMLLYDYTFTEPEMQDREPGTVNWTTMRKGYVRPSDWISKGIALGEL